jgi:hypothetical protein
MKTRSVRVLCDVHCEWDDVPPKYRLFVNGELFAERTWIWKDFYLEEAIHIDALPGMYQIQYEVLNNDASIRVKNPRIDHGTAVMHKHLRLEILP